MKLKRMAVLLAALGVSASMMAGCAAGQKEAAQTETAQTEALEDEENYDTGDASLDDARNQDGIGENELLVVSFGTSFNDSRRLTIGAIESAIESAFPDYSVRRGFTSQIIIDHVKSRDNVGIDNVGEALDRAVANGVKNLVVQPTHLMNGLEYNDLVSELAEYSDAFEHVAVGQPLLTTDEDFKAVIEAITKATAEYDDGETAICFMGHGTEAESNQVYGKMQEMLTAAGYEHYYVGTVEAEPGLNDVLEAVGEGQYKKVVLEPLMIVAGDHANNDMAGDEEDSWKTAFEYAGYEVTCLLRGLGELEDIQKLFVEHARAAVEGENAVQAKESKEDMAPVYGTELKDGTYPVEVTSSSSMFRITECQLTVKDGSMSAVMTMGGTGYLKLFMGTSEEAMKADESAFIPYSESADGVHSFEIPVEALNMAIDCSAFSKNKEKWYDRTLVFQADSLPAEAFAEGKIVSAGELGLADGMYTAEVVLEGGSGRASIESPAGIRVEDGKVFATIVWGSANYDYMKVGDEKIEWHGTEGNSTFEIPVEGFDWKIPVIADTIAMSTPHEVSYTLTFVSSSIQADAGVSTAATPVGGPAAGATTEAALVSTSAHSMDLKYANQFSVGYREDGCALITIKETGKFLVVPENGQVPDGLPGDITVLKQPLSHIYLTATSAMDLFRSIDGLDRITLSGTDASGWYIKEAKEAVESGKILYAGKYNAPDYERILSNSCDLAIESTMIYHNPEVKEQLEQLGIPVLVERSSYESHPLGRMEWVRLYGVLLGKEKEADRCFFDTIKKLEPVMEQEPTGKTAAFFYITSNGSVNVRKSGDYVAKTIELAGGTYVPQGLSENENALSTMNMQMEAFYAAARDADFLIYNSAIDGELQSLDELLVKSSLLADFKAVKEGNVWCTGKNLFQESMGLGDLLLDMNRLFTETNPDPLKMAYLHKLQ